MRLAEECALLCNMNIDTFSIGRVVTSLEPFHAFPREYEIMNANYQLPQTVDETHGYSTSTAGVIACRRRARALMQVLVGSHYDLAAAAAALQRDREVPAAGFPRGT
jgi:hypothetical protein